jgi:hypothetical protein
VIQQLKKERTRLADELHRVTAALTAFGKSYISGGNPKTANYTKRTISAAARKKISLAQKKRWAAARKESKPAAVAAKRTLSASARRKIAAAQKLRWAKSRAQAKKAA